MPQNEQADLFNQPPMAFCPKPLDDFQRSQHPMNCSFPSKGMN
jgi:hypothetical protein